MIIAQLIGGNEIKGYNTGVVYINDKKLDDSYETIAAVCGSIPLDEIDTDINLRRSTEDIRDDYATLVHQHDETLGGDFVDRNQLTAFVSYSTYEIDPVTHTLTLRIDAFEG